MTNTTEIHQLLHTDYVRLSLAGSSKDEVLNGVIDLVQDHPNVNNFEGVRHAIFKRERIMSTGVGKGLALPHAKTSAVDGIVLAFATTAEPIEFGSVDKLPVRLIFLMLSTEHEKTRHIKLLSRVSRCMNEDRFRDRLLDAESASQVVSIFQEGG